MTSKKFQFDADELGLMIAAMLNHEKRQRDSQLHAKANRCAVILKKLGYEPSLEKSDFD